MKYIISIFIFTIFIIIFTAGCGSDNSVSVDQATQDNEVSSALNQAFSETFSQIQITPLTDGNDENYPIDITLNSPVSGNAKIDGMITIDGQTGRTNWMLRYGFWQYKVSKSAQTYVILNGLITYAGFFNQYTSNFTIKGTISVTGKVQSQNINETCAYDLTANINSQTGTGSITGSICGRSVNSVF